MFVLMYDICTYGSLVGTNLHISPRLASTALITFCTHVRDTGNQAQSESPCLQVSVLLVSTLPCAASGTWQRGVHSQ